MYDLDWEYTSELAQIILTIVFFFFKDYIPFRNGKIESYRYSNTPGTPNTEMLADHKDTFLVALISLPCDFITVAAGCSLGRVFTIYEHISQVPNKTQSDILLIKLFLTSLVVLPFTILVYYFFATSTNLVELKHKDSSGHINTGFRFYCTVTVRIILSLLFAVLFINFNFPI